MFYLKNNDMEELFRKAAENYEVDPSGASDWEGVYRAIQKDPIEQNPPKPGRRKKRRFFFWWLLLFPAGWISHQSWDKFQPSGAAGKTDEAKAVGTHVGAGAGRGEQMVLSTANDTPATEGNKEKSTITPGATGISGETKENQVAGGTGNDGDSKTKTIRKPDHLSAASRQPYVGETKQEAADHPGKKTGISMTENRIIKGSDFATMQTSALYKPYTLMLNNRRLPEIESERFIVPEPKQAAPTVPAGNDSDTGHPANTSLSGKNRYFYMQAIAGPDITTVQYQRMAGIGYGAGLLAGYSFNRRWHVEAGGIWEKKMYYSGGKYIALDKSSLGWQNDHEIYSLDGACHMVTIAANLRYNFSVTTKTKWFVTGGALAYLMNKEDYHISYDYYGNYRERSYTYKDPPDTWMAAINISAGYERDWGRSFNFRIEPYIRVPVSGAGTGNLSLSSAGIFLGIGKKINR